ncbi:hypothetical protein BDC45DRAFT_18537 [Circinella umbellata]|nr:hypothetical protein BDC45DRAFT_18537 [Circinella umbellata]
MSGETPPGRFQSLNKKFPGSMSPGPNNHSPNGRGGHNRSRVLTSKVSAPRPINLPSLRREHASDWPTSGNGQGSNTTSSSSTTTNSSSNTIGAGLNSTGTTSEIKGWGSPSISQLSSSPKWDDTTTNNQVDTTEWPTTSDNNNSDLQSSSPVPKVSSPVPVSSSSPNNSPHPSAAASRAWATVSTSSTPALSGEFPTAAETSTAPTQESNTDTSSTASAMTTKVDKSKTEKKPESRAEKTILNETENLDWDEIVRQDLENDDPPTPVENETVLPSDRFTEDYDRSYPPQIHPVSDHARPHSSSPSTHNTSYHNNNTRSSPSQQQQQNYHSSSLQSSPSGYYNNNKNNGGYSRRDNSNNSWGNQHHHHNDWNDGHSRNNQERRGSIDRINNDSNSTAWGGRNRRDSYGSESGGRGRGRGGNRYGNRRPSHDRTSNFQPTSLLQRPRRMSELSQRSDRSTSRDETSSVSDTIQPATTSPVTLSVVSEQGQGQQREETLSSSPGHRYTAAQREVMLTTAERAKKRRAEEEAELEASRERARKKAEALAALCESKPKSTAVKSDEDNSVNKSTTETSKTPVASSSLEDNKTATKPENENKSSVPLNDSTSTCIKGSDVNQKPETKDEPSETKEKDVATSKQKDPSTRSDAASPKDSGKASTAWTQSPDNPHQLEDEEDNQRWEDYVKGVQSNKSSTEDNNTNDAATSWNNYATRLQTSTEIRMNAAIDRFAAERNIDPSRLNNMRPKDREPLRLHRPQRDNYDNNNNRRGYNNNNRNGDDKYNNRNGDHRHQYRDDGRRDNYSRHKEKEQLTSPSKEHPLNLELWPSLGEGQSTTNDSDQTSMTDQKVSLDNNGGDNSKIKTKKKKNE